MNYIFYNSSSAAVRSFIAGLMGTEEVSLHLRADYRELTDLSVDSVRETIGWCELAGKRFVFIPHAEELSPESSNALLKTLEERTGATFVFGSSARLIDTIESRCRVISGRSGREQFRSYILARYPHIASDPQMLESLARFTLSEDKADEILGEAGIFSTVVFLDSHFNQLMDEPVKRLGLFGMLHEKDSSNFFDTNRGYVTDVCDYFVTKCMEGLMSSTGHEQNEWKRHLDVAVRHSKLSRTATYAKSDFFEFLATV